MSVKHRLSQEGRGVTTDEQKYVVRVWDGFDGVWTDVTEPVSKADADRVWNEKTNNGTRATSFDDISYYAIFPANTRMRFVSGHSLMGAEDRWER